MREALELRGKYQEPMGKGLVIIRDLAVLLCMEAYKPPREVRQYCHKLNMADADKQRGALITVSASLVSDGSSRQ